MMLLLSFLSIAFFYSSYSNEFRGDSPILIDSMIENTALLTELDNLNQTLLAYDKRKNFLIKACLSSCGLLILSLFLSITHEQKVINCLPEFCINKFIAPVGLISFGGMWVIAFVDEILSVIESRQVSRQLDIIYKLLNENEKRRSISNELFEKFIELTKKYKRNIKNIKYQNTLDTLYETLLAFQLLAQIEEQEIL